MLDPDLGEFTLPSAFRFFKPQDLTGVIKANGLWRWGQACGNRFRYKGCKLRPQSKDVAFTIDFTDDSPDENDPDKKRKSSKDNGKNKIKM